MDIPLSNRIQCGIWKQTAFLLFHSRHIQSISVLSLFLFFLMIPIVIIFIKFKKFLFNQDSKSVSLPELNNTLILFIFFSIQYISASFSELKIKINIIVRWIALNLSFFFFEKWANQRSSHHSLLYHLERNQFLTISFQLKVDQMETRIPFMFKIPSIIILPIFSSLQYLLTNCH